MTNEKKAKRKQSRLSQANTPKGWKKVRDIAGTIFSIGTLILATVATGGLALPVTLITTVSLITGVAGILSGRAALARDKNLIDNDK